MLRITCLWFKDWGLEVRFWLAPSHIRAGYILFYKGVEQTIREELH